MLLVEVGALDDPSLRETICGNISLVGVDVLGDPLRQK